MQMNHARKKQKRASLEKLLRIMKITTVLLLAFLLRVNANVNSQSVTLNLQNVSLTKVFKEIHKQTGHNFLSLIHISEPTRPY